MLQSSIFQNRPRTACRRGEHSTGFGGYNPACMLCCKDSLKRRKRDQIEPSVLQNPKKGLNHTVRELDFDLRYYSSEKFTLN